MKKPPNKGQFKKGVSGNPHGRPKGKPNLSTVLNKILAETIVIEEDGKKRTATNLEAVARGLIEKAKSRDVPALRLLSILTASTDGSEMDLAELAREDQKILESLARRFERAGQPKSN